MTNLNLSKKPYIKIALYFSIQIIVGSSSRSTKTKIQKKNEPNFTIFFVSLSIEVCLRYQEFISGPLILVIDWWGQPHRWLSV